MKKPVIGILPLIDTEKESYWMLPGYVEGVKEAGGLPVILTFTKEQDDAKEMAQLCDGFIFTGGHDVSPEIYGEEKLPECAEISIERDTVEKLLLKEVLDMDKPVLGICRGLQFINAALGGTLYQDLKTYFPTDVIHRQKAPYDVPVHNVKIEEGTPFRDLFGKEEIEVNSCHHQAIKKLSDKAIVMAKAPDGLIEAFYLPDKKFVWATQWHPEYLHKVDENSKKIFKAFIDAAK